MAKSVMSRIDPAQWEGLDVTTTNGRFEAIARCSHDGCDAEHRWSSLSMPNTELVKSKFRQAHWGFRHRGPLCPIHLHNRKPRAEKPVVTKEDTVMASSAAPTPIKPEPSDAAKALRRMTFMAIEDAYDEAAKAYKPGHTDATIAAAVGGGCPVTLVASIRTEFFGPAAPPEPPIVAEFRAKIESLRVDIDTAERTAAAAINGCRDTMAALKKQMDDVCKANKWA